MPAKQHRVPKPTAIERQDREQIEKIQTDDQHRDFDQRVVGRDNAGDRETGADQDARQRPHQRDDRLLPAWDVEVAPRHRGAEERYEKHSQLAVFEPAHRGVMAELVDEKNADYQDAALPTPGGGAGSREEKKRPQEQNQTADDRTFLAFAL